MRRVKDLIREWEKKGIGDFKKEERKTSKNFRKQEKKKINTPEVWLEKICETYGEDFRWPPYPDKFDASAIPKFIKNRWIHKEFKFSEEQYKVYYSLKSNQKIENISEGDIFNAIVIKKRKATGYKGLPRILQFDMKGYVKDKNVKAGLVYRFKVTSVEKNCFYCTPIYNSFTKNNLINNLADCYYKKSEEKPIIKKQNQS